MRWIFGYGTAICIMLIIISQSIIFPTFFMPFFTWQYNRLGVSETIQVEHDELMRVTGELLDYMRGRRDTIEDITAVVAGEERIFFSYIEVKHMVDVLDLYNIAFMVRNVAFFVAVAFVLAMILLRHRVLYMLARCSREVMAAFLIISAIVVGLIALNFDRAFVIFHLIFFNNDYWILDPRVDLLINMVPIYFFIHISIFIALVMVISSVAIIVAATLYLRHMPERTLFRP